jgi:uncharacterized membrane protein
MSMAAINIPTSDMILFAHPTVGVLGILASVWVLVEALNATDRNQTRTRVFAWIAALCIIAAWILGGYWYTLYYAPEKAIILKGPWPWAHDIVMETKEHLFFIPLILALFLPIAAAKNLARNTAARAVVIATVLFMIVSGLAIEGAGALINFGVKVAYVHTGVKGTE